MAKRAPKALKSLVDMAHEEGYEPGRHVVEHLTTMKAKLAAWKYSIEKHGTPSDEYLDMPLDDFKAMYKKEAAELWRLETQVMEYFHPKMRSTESAVSVEGEISLLELLTRGRDS